MLFRRGFKAGQRAFQAANAFFCLGHFGVVHGSCRASWSCGADLGASIPKILAHAFFVRVGFHAFAFAF